MDGVTMMLKSFGVNPEALKQGVSDAQKLLEKMQADMAAMYRLQQETAAKLDTVLERLNNDGTRDSGSGAGFQSNGSDAERRDY